MVTAATPTTMAIMLRRISRATETAEGDSSTECLTIKGAIETACLTPTSEMSIDGALFLLNISFNCMYSVRLDLRRFHQLLFIHNARLCPYEAATHSTILSLLRKDRDGAWQGWGKVPGARGSIGLIAAWRISSPLRQSQKGAPPNTVRRRARSLNLDLTQTRTAAGRKTN